MYFGMTTSTAINVFAKAVVRERKIPFEIVSPEPEITREELLEHGNIIKWWIINIVN